MLELMSPDSVRFPPLIATPPLPVISPRKVKESVSANAKVKEPSSFMVIEPVVGKEFTLLI